MFPNNLILNGFDRCGSSAISRTLYNHPRIELIFQPFNSGSIRQKMHMILNKDNVSKEDRDFFCKLEKGILQESYIKSEWHKRYSTVRTFKHNQLHVIKTTLNHLTIGWIRKEFPNIEFWGIWRNPMDILASIIRNDFYKKWYSTALDEVLPSVEQDDKLRSIYFPFVKEINSEPQAMAFLIAVRSYYFFSRLPSNKVIIYEQFLADPNLELDKILNYFNLSSFDYSPYIKTDLNVSGKRYQNGKSHRGVLSNEDISFAKKLFNYFYDFKHLGFCEQ